MVYDPERQRSFLFGGYQGSTALGDSWEWDGQNWVQRPVSGPQARGGHAMTYDSHRGQALLFGGSGASGSFFGDTWTWDGQVWNLAANSGPSARELVGLAFDSVQGYAVLFGGKYGPYYDDSWKWDGSQWLSMNATGPPARFAGDMVFDQARSEFVLYGGWNGNNLGDTWKLGGDTSVIIQQHPQDAWAPSGGAASFSVVTQLGVGTVQYQWRRNGQPLSDGGTLSGSQTSILQFSQAYPGDAGTYDVEITDACQTLISETAELRVGGPILQLTTSCPNGGPASLSWTGATPHGAIAVLFALQAGNFTVPGGYACAGTQLGLGAPGLQVVHQASSDAQGEGTAQGSAGPNLCGRFFQLIDLQTCAVSNVVQAP
ncbi:MAG: hypothetical protein DWQ01_22015 [Planctomycetota bacterium]|nr:MAG: hypothetical protein DWQ01_22015 [Planctomycetota bacterium]